MVDLAAQECKMYHDNHYSAMKAQPIEVMQSMLSPEAFIGALLSQVIKYYMRAGHKQGECPQKEYDKMERYLAWHYHAIHGEMINPILDYDCPFLHRERVLAKIDKMREELELCVK